MGIARTVRATGLALGAAAVVAGGFLVPPPIRRPAGIGPAVTSGKVELPEGLPEGFVRYAHAAFGDPIPGFRTAVIWGRAAMNPTLTGPWLPTTMATNHLLGEAFAAEFALTWFGAPLLRSADAFEDGRGVVERFGWTADRAPEHDRSAAMFMWLEAGMFPQTWSRPGVGFEQVDDVTLRLTVPDATDPITWHLDRETGLPGCVEAPRYRSVGGPKIGWRAELGPWRRFGDIRWWSGAAAIWEDQGRPWLRWTVDGVTPGASVTAALRRHRPRP